MSGSAGGGMLGPIASSPLHGGCGLQAWRPFCGFVVILNA